ncbi:MAG: aminotransferase class V-fold PLP-dependent enzyme [Clostridia bacterium]|nr:aminotransferase class V-fold PLP-dependent enzyme [Clostridia bacterium]
MTKEIYLDNSATTPLSAAAENAMREAMTCYGNPSSLHMAGQRSKKLLEESREKILACLGVRQRQGELIFTSCGTEATSTALLGCAFAKERREASVILTTDSEHPATMRALEHLEKKGFEVIKIATRGGVLDIDGVKRILADSSKKIFMASFMLVNNETGALYRVGEAFKEIKKKHPSAITHCDAVQGFMRVGFTPSSISADLISISGHKIHAPKGVGALYISPELIKAKKIVSYLCGGGQEKGMRSGTENIIGISAFAAAAHDMRVRSGEISEKLSSLYAYADERLSVLDVRINIPLGDKVSHIINITLPSIKSETMLHFLSGRGIYVSSGSACSSHSRKTSSALLAFGLNEREADCSIRVSLSEYNTKEDIDALCEALRQGIDTLVRIR